MRLCDILPILFSFCVLISILGCESKKTGVLGTKELVKTASIVQVSGTEAQCAVFFYEAADLTKRYTLEEDGIVVCNGHIAVFNGLGYSVTFENFTNSPVLLTIIRPQAGVSTAEYLYF